MVKTNQPLQIRLTEPVVFLRGPSTGLDFRGRPQGIDPNAAPAQLRGLLTLRLTKPTRIRKITIKLDGKARTEWPEGIGPRRLDTFEEHVLINETTTFFDAKQNRSQSARRAASVGPGVYTRTSELEQDDELRGRSSFLVDTPESVEPERGRDRIPRSASALPGIQDGYDWNRSSRDADPQPPPAIHTLSLTDVRGPSPAYTPTVEHNRLTPSNLNANATANAGGNSPRGFRETVLSPIQSAAPSRATSDRDDSTETQRRASDARASTRLPDVDERPDNLDSGGSASTPETPAQYDDEHGNAIRSILSGTGQGRGSLGEVRFAAEDTTDSATEIADEAGASSAGVVEDYHPAGSAIQSISAMSTAHNSPAPSRPQSILTSHSVEELPETNGTAERRSNESARSSIHSNRSLRSLRTRNEPPTSSISSRRSSLLRDTRLSTTSSAASSTASLQEVRQGRKNRHGSHSTIVINTDPNVAPEPPIEPISSRPPSPTRRSSEAPNLVAENNPYSTSERGRRTGSGRFSLAATLRGISKDVKERVRGSSRSKSRASMTRAGASTSTSTPPDVPPPSSSTRGRGTTPRERDGSRSRSTTRSIANAFLPPHLDRPQSHSRSPAPTQRAMRSGSFTQDPDFVPPYGRGGAARINNSRERERSREGRGVSPSIAAGPSGTGLGRVREEEDVKGKGKERSPSRGRGRNKGMKVLTGALGLGDGEDDKEDVHNWKEFKKGVYNYPISFPIPLTAPPTIRAEFGSVIYRLKATVVKVGALTPNLVEELEVTMIATPQEDDLEETENVIVERQWEEQMRYQIALSGKAFPIGGTIPMSIRLMPLMKCKVHRLTVCLEEKSDYFAQGRKVVRHESPRKYTMLFIKQPERKERIEPLLPIITDDADAARESPLAELAKTAALNNPTNYTNFAGELDDDALYASMMDPLGPWALEQELQIPDCAQKVRFTTKHEKTNITVSHWLKVTIRVERGDDEAVDAKGRRKLFDIIIETPIKILDCRVTPQYNSLPTYSSFIPNSPAMLTRLCSVHGSKAGNTSAQTALISRHSGSVGSTILTNGVLLGQSGQSGSRVDLAHSNAHPPSPFHHTNTNGKRREEGDDTLLERNIVYDRLMSGQETEEGDVPPSYDVASSTPASVTGSGSLPGSTVNFSSSRQGSVQGIHLGSNSGLNLNLSGNSHAYVRAASASRSRPPHPLRRESSGVGGGAGGGGGGGGGMSESDHTDHTDHAEGEEGVVRMGESSRSRERERQRRERERERERGREGTRSGSGSGSRSRSRNASRSLGGGDGSGR